MTTIAIREETCAKCGSCVQICPTLIFAQQDRSKYPTAMDTANCLACGHCMAICPTSSVEHSDISPDRVSKISRDVLPSTDSLMELLLSRRSVREFSDEPVERGDMETVIEAALAAPSAHNCQSTEFIVIREPKLLNEIRIGTLEYWKGFVGTLKNPIGRIIMRLMAGKQINLALEMLPMMEGLIDQVEHGVDLILCNAPALMVFHSHIDAEMGDINANLAYQNASLAAETLGLGAFYAGFILRAASQERNRKVNNLLGVPEDHTVHALMAMGHAKFKYKNYIRHRPAKIQWL